MSRLPTATALKRKASEEPEGASTYKVAALAKSTSQTFQTSRVSATSTTANARLAQLTVPRAPLASITPNTESAGQVACSGKGKRAASAPPKSVRPLPGPGRVPVAPHSTNHAAVPVLPAINETWKERVEQMEEQFVGIKNVQSTCTSPRNRLCAS